MLKLTTIKDDCPVLDLADNVSRSPQVRWKTSFLLAARCYAEATEWSLSLDHSARKKRSANEKLYHALFTTDLSKPRTFCLYSCQTMNLTGAFEPDALSA